MQGNPKSKVERLESKSRIVINDCGEALVDVKKAIPQAVVVLDKDRPMQAAYLRKTVVGMLKRAQRLLPKGMTFVIRDAWRSSDVQRQIMESFVARFKSQHPNWTEKRARQEAEKFVAGASGPLASGHMTGGAVDVRLWKKGRRVPMRSWRLTYQENAQPYQPKLPKHLQRNREIMFRALSSVGFSQCHNEFWHWSYGDVQWAQRTGSGVARYGVIGVVGKVESWKVGKSETGR